MKKTYWFRNVLFSCIVLLIAACGQAVTPTLSIEKFPQPTATLPHIDAQTESTATYPFLETEKDDAQMTQPNMPSGMETLIDKAKEDLAQKLELSGEHIKVVAVIGQDFSAAAFYCQETKERIAKEEPQQVMSGHSILLSVSGRRYEYHANEQMVIFCRSLR